MKINHVIDKRGIVCGKICCTKIENFGVNYNGNQVFENVNLHIHCGELTAIIGPNGAGKSTLLKAVLGEVKHSGNLAYVDAKGARTGNPLIGYVPQHLNFDITMPITVLDLFNVCLSNEPTWLNVSKNIKTKVSELLIKVKAEHLINRKLGALSGGELQRVLLALALQPVPDLLLLDEPVSGIDKNGLDLFYNIVSDLRMKHDLSIILVSHDFNLVSKYADRVILLNKTIVANDSPQVVFASTAVQETFGLYVEKKAEEESFC